MNRLKELRLEIKMSQSELADIFNISQQAVSHYEKGLRDMDNTLIASMANYFNVSTDYLLGISKVKNHNNITPEDKINKTLKDNGLETIAAHFEGEEFTKDDLEDIENFISYIISKKKSK